MSADPPVVWELARLLAADLGPAEVWASGHASAVLAPRLPLPFSTPFRPLNDETATLIVSGGGTFLDEAKVWRHEEGKKRRLVAIPSIWGSGAEASPVAVRNGPDGKEIRMGAEYLPDARVVVPEFAATISVERAREACGDVWAHAVEGFLSPLASDLLRRELAELMREMQVLPLTNDPRWFEASARACWGQARSGVGVVHGIAHALERPLQSSDPAGAWGHARLCATFLGPVMNVQLGLSDRVRAVFDQYGLDADRLRPLWMELSNPDARRAAWPVLEANWESVLRDRCTRMNSVLVRPEFLSALRAAA